MNLIESPNLTLIPNRYYRFARIAFDLARLNTFCRNYHFCALVVVRNRVLSIGYNRPKSHPKSIGTTPQCQIHAELDAINRCMEPLEGAYMVVARAKGIDGAFAGLGRPCDICEQTIREAGIRRVYYTVEASTPGDVKIEQLKI